MEGFGRVDKHNGPVQPALLEVEGLLHDIEEVRLLPPVAPPPSLLYWGLQQLVLVDLELVAPQILLYVQASLVSGLARQCTHFESFAV